MVFDETAVAGVTGNQEGKRLNSEESDDSEKTDHDRESSQPNREFKFMLPTQRREGETRQEWAKRLTQEVIRQIEANETEKVAAEGEGKSGLAAVTPDGNSGVIPKPELTNIKIALRHLVQERTSAQRASYSEEEFARDEYDLEEIERIRTVADVVELLGDFFPDAPLIEFQSCIDYRGGFSVEGKEFPDEEDEEAFLQYLEKEYGITKS